MLFCDVDGTLVEFADHPDDVVVPGELVPLLNAVNEALGGAFAIVSGRSIESIDRLLPGYAGIRVGLHGGASGIPGSPVTVERGCLSVMPSRVREAVHSIASAVPTSFVEEKGPCVALHHRLDEGGATALTASLRKTLVGLPSWHVFRGRRVIEIRPKSIHKGLAVRAMLDAPHFRERTPVCMGDDDTDVDLFEAAHANGGFSIAVGNRVVQHADFALANPVAARAWLRLLSSRKAELN